MVDTHAAVLARAVELKNENERLEAEVASLHSEVERLRGRIAEASRILEDSEPDDVDIYRVQCALEGKEW